MSLVVWLPMTKDLKNQGLDNVTVTNNGATFNSAGKLGGCYSFSGSSQKIVNTLPSTITSSVGSLSCWIKMNSLPGSSSFYNLLQLGALGGYANCRLGLYMEYTNYINISIDGSSTGTNRYTHSMVANQWYHLCATYDGTTVKLYIDGNEVLSKTASKGSYTTAAPNLYIGGTSSYYLNGYMNDARYYDHCLSPMEVKELSKGLVLHYPLNRNGWGQENFILESHKVTSGGNASGITRTYESDGSIKIISTSGNGNYASLGFAQNSNTSVGNNMAVGDTYCISCDAKIESGSTLPTLFINSGNGYKQLKPVSGSIITGQWMRVYYTSTWADPGTNYGNISLHLGFSGAIGTYYFKNFKLEKGSIPTPWCPNAADANNMSINGTTEYDCSGFCNNGTKNGTYSYTSDTPKYAVSTNFSGTETIATATTGADILTLSCWAKTGKSSSTSQMMVADSASKLCCSFYQGNFISFYGGNSGYDTGSKCFLGSEYKENEWNHFVSVKTGEGTRDCYCNGVKLTPTTNDWWSTVTGFWIGNRKIGGNLPFYGQICDVRAYATALSADDVKSLYQNSAYIDSSGNVYGAAH